MIKKCHSEHMQIYKNKAKVSVTFYADEYYVIYHLANKHYEGCISEFIKKEIAYAVKHKFDKEIKSDVQKIRDIKSGKVSLIEKFRRKLFVKPKREGIVR